MTLVSVTMATYNRNDILFSRAIPSILRQTHREWEMHLVMDGMMGEELDDLERRLADLPRHNITLWYNPRQTYPEDPQERWCVLGLNARNHALDHVDGGEHLPEELGPGEDRDAQDRDHRSFG